LSYPLPRLFRFLAVFPLLFLYLFLFFRKTLKEKEVMEEPESLLLNPLIAVLTSSWAAFLPFPFSCID